MDARKTRIAEGDAWDLLKEAGAITTVKGKKVVELTPCRDGREVVLAEVIGPSGNLRAPTLRIGDRFVIGFDGSLYETLFGKP